MGYTCVERSQQRVGRTDWKIQAPSFYFFRKIVVLSRRILLVQSSTKQVTLYKRIHLCDEDVSQAVVNDEDQEEEE